VSYSFVLQLFGHDEGVSVITGKIKVNFIHPFSHEIQTQTVGFTVLQWGFDIRDGDIFRAEGPTMIMQNDRQSFRNYFTKTFNTSAIFATVGMLNDIGASFINCQFNSIDGESIKASGRGRFFSWPL
jgi:hypothetical protein